METKKYNIFYELILSIYNFKAYKSFTKNKAGKTFLFGLILSLIKYLIFILTFAIGLNLIFNSLSTYVEEYFPDFTIYDGVLTTDEAVEKNFGELYLCVDTNRDFTLDDIAVYSKDNEFVILADKQKLVLSYKGEMQTFGFDNLGTKEPITKDFIINILPTIKKALMALFSLSLVGFIFAVFFSALWYSLFIIVMNSILRTNLNFSEMYKISLHICTVPTLLSGIVSLCYLRIPLFGIIKFVIVMFYSYFILKAIKEDNENQTLEIENIN